MSEDKFFNNYDILFVISDFIDTQNYLNFIHVFNIHYFHGWNSYKKYFKEITKWPNYQINDPKYELKTIKHFLIIRDKYLSKHDAYRLYGINISSPLISESIVTILSYNKFGGFDSILQNRKIIRIKENRLRNLSNTLILSGFTISTKIKSWICNKYINNTNTKISINDIVQYLIDITYINQVFDQKFNKTVEILKKQHVQWKSKVYDIYYKDFRIIYKNHSSLCGKVELPSYQNFYF